MEPINFEVSVADLQSLMTQPDKAISSILIQSSENGNKLVLLGIDEGNNIDLKQPAIHLKPLKGTDGQPT